MSRSTMFRRLAFIISLVVLLGGAAFTYRYSEVDRAFGQTSSAASGQSAAVKPPAPAPGDGSISNAELAKLIKTLSESNGYFDTDNLISNEASYLHVLGKLRRMGVQGGAYIGVGPDQNFAYICQIKPKIAYIIDIRRDNLLQHLLFKGIFSQARNRVEYLAVLMGKPVPADVKSWDGKTLQQIVEYIDKTPAQRERFEKSKAAIAAHLRSLELNLNDADITAVGRIHEAFFQDGLDLRFTSKNRPPRSYYPTYRDLLVEKDLTGKQASFIGSEDDFQFLKTMEAKNLLIPVVGNLAGDHALAAIGRDATERGLTVSSFYTSNVEFYLMREGGFDRYVENLRKLPTTDQSVIIRSYFSGGFGYSHPQGVAGYYSTQLLQTIPSLIKEYTSGGYDSYSDLVTKHSLELR